MKLSIIIPAYNRDKLLAITLDYIAAQKDVDPDTYETIIVDDGSEDGTKAVYESYRRRIRHLKYVYRARDERSCRSRARNLGLAESIGEMVMFLDTSMLIPSHFVRNLYRLMDEHAHPKLNIYHYMMGMWVEPGKHDLAILDELTPDNMAEITQQLLKLPEWLDNREGLFQLADHDLNKLAAPWTLGWSGCYTVNRAFVQEAGGFDEAFLGWGAEDTDLSYRLYKLGARIIADSEAPALHLPHFTPTEASVKEVINKRINNGKNLMLQHQKRYEFDTEFFQLYPGPYYNHVLARFHSLSLMEIVPGYSSELLQGLRETILGEQRSALIGSDLAYFIEGAGVTDVFLQNPNVIGPLGRKLPGVRMHYLLGMHTPFEDKAFDTVIITDYIRAFPGRFAMRLLKEASRIARRVVLLFTDEYNSVVNWLDGQHWSDYELIRKSASANKLAVTELAKIESTRVLELKGPPTKADALVEKRTKNEHVERVPITASQTGAE
ncbi:glycosyltransferase family 2 protein [Paenibacillus aurantiacus]|uniref:Glycosyltransferase family 2 protein n=1 Tax=Paenibacillus aurantiacus TaxID=1936118 RepID=A0ABV5KT20_9BACL